MNRYILYEDSEGPALSSDAEVNNLIKIIKSIKKTSAVGYFGPYGSGKTKITKEVFKKRKGYKFYFSVLDYSDRKSLWDGFVIELISDITNEDKNDIAKQIDGYRDNIFSKFISAHSLFLIIFVPILHAILSFALWSLLNIDFIVDYLKYAFATLFSLLIFLGIELLPKNSSPVRRKFQLEKRLSEVIEHSKIEDILLVIDDVDRGGEESWFFAEATKSFFKKQSKKTVILLPLSNACMIVDQVNNQKPSGIKNITKLIDYESYKKPTSSPLEEPQGELANFISKVFKSDEDVKKIIMAITDEAFRSNRQLLSFREIKYCLRSSLNFVDNNLGTKLEIAYAMALIRLLASANEPNSRDFVERIYSTRGGGSYLENGYIANIFTRLTEVEGLATRTVKFEGDSMSVEVLNDDRNHKYIKVGSIYSRIVGIDVA